MSKCRFCGTKLNYIFVDLGKTPPSNSFLDDNSLNKKESKYPLCALVCHNCFLVQLDEFVTPQNIFSKYAYFSSYSTSWLNHAKNFVDMMIKRFDLNKDHQIIEIASNDGYLLQYFNKKNIKVLGIEPAANVAQASIEKNIPTIVDFFSTKLAKELKIKHICPDVIVGNNVLAQVPNLNNFVKGIKILLKPNGILTIEFPHLLQLIKQTQFDTIYHEHFSYFSALTVSKILAFHGLTIFDIEELKTHGGSLRIFVKHSKNSKIKITKNVKKIFLKEKKFGLDTIETYQNFSQSVKKIKHDLRKFLINAKNKSKKVVCYGAPAKGNTLLNFCEIGTDLIQYAVDLNPFKQGLFLPGSHIPIMAVEKIRETKPDYLLILPWNLKEEIISQMSYIREWDGCFIIPIPEVKAIHDF